MFTLFALAFVVMGVLMAGVGIAESTWGGFTRKSGDRVPDPTCVRRVGGSGLGSHGAVGGSGLGSHGAVGGSGLDTAAGEPAK